MKKKILIIAPGNILPSVMASQTRINDMVKYLSKNHIVDLVVLTRSENDEKYYSELNKICRSIYFIRKNNSNQILRYILAFIRYLADLLLITPSEAFYPGFPSTRKKILKIAVQNEYDIVQSEYWYQGKILEQLPSRIFRVIDTHDVLHQKKSLNLTIMNQRLSWYQRAWLAAYRKKELASLGKACLIIAISNLDSKYFRNAYPSKKHLTIPMGVEIPSILANYDQREKYILFYGSMGSKSNNDAFWRLWSNIYPVINSAFPTGIIILGANPSSEIKNLHNGTNVIVTGFVSDVKPLIVKASLAILPLEGGGGFRSRIIEIMSLGLPVIGTHNALDCVELTHGLHGYITDKDDEMASYAIEILSDDKKRKIIGLACRKFVKDSYSIKETYHKLSNFYSELCN